MRELHQSWLVSYEAIGKLAGVCATTVKHIAEGTPSRRLPPPARITARTSDALLTVTVDDLPDNYLVNAVGSTRRLRALSVAGWPMQQVADQAGADWTGLKELRRGERTTVLLRTARLIRDVYLELIQRDPYEHCRPAVVTSSRNQAATNGWHPAAAWADAIDDPEAKPWQMVRCSYPTCIHGAKDERLLCDTHLQRLSKRGTLEGMRAVRNGKVLIEDIQFILATDPPINPETEEIDRDRLAERLGITWHALEQALIRAKINLGKLRESA
ncbi:hypothetical protein HNP84_010286 [Thermocatellispora tengchongensis]|uniref:Uncharacterized protein n=1 Tax=Thermocatellispora tengchongensis TaxID=1073253 RepID=A0A840PLZ8_9ACTN|nr:hypothetical protein [Thermocatellispora tengchongensis]MBB5140518.1 hypothetical protein [Thermocatellispora tengchongensis]